MTTRINKTDGTQLVEIFDGDADTSTSPLTLIGRLYRNYGELVNENFVKLLENFANSVSPDPALVGQLWYDTGSQTLNVYRSGGFIGLAILTTSAAAPNVPSQGDMWYDTYNEQLKIYSGSVWIPVAPQFTSRQGKSGLFVETIRDSLNNEHVCMVTYQSNSVISLQCRDPQWYPQTAIGIPVINPGINLVDINSQEFVGTASNAAALGGQPASKYLRNDIDGSIDGSLTLTNAGLIIGAFEDFQLTVDTNKSYISRNDGSINLTIGPDTILQLNETSQALLIDGIDSIPALAFISEPNSGLFKVSDKVLGVAINGNSMVEISEDGLYVNGNIQGNNTFIGDLSAGGITATTITTTDLNVLGNSTVNALLVNGNVTLGNAGTDRVTINSTIAYVPNDLLIDDGDVRIGLDLFVNGTLKGDGGIQPLLVSPGLNVNGRIQATGSLVVGETLNVADLFIIDGLGRYRMNGGEAAIGYENSGDVTLGSTNGISAYNTPKMWVAFNGTLSGLAIDDSFDIDYVTRTSANHYTFTTTNPITSGAMAVVGTNGANLVANPSIGAITFSIITTSENAHMGLVVLSQ